MPIIYIGSAQAGENQRTITLPPHQAGDLIIFVASGQTGNPGPPSGYNILYSIGVFPSYLTVAYIKATSSSTIVPNWTTGTHWLTASVYRNANIGNNQSTVNTSSSSTTINYPAVSFVNTTGSSLTFGAITHAQPSAPINTNIPIGWSNLTYQYNLAQVNALAVSADNNVGETGFSGASFSSITPAGTWSSFVTELLYSEDTSVSLVGVTGSGVIGTAIASISPNFPISGVSAAATTGSVSIFIGTANLVLVEGVQTEAEINSVSINSGNSVVVLGNTLTGYVGTVTIPTGLVGVVGELPPPFAAVTIWDRIITSGNV